MQCSDPGEGIIMDLLIQNHSKDTEDATDHHGLPLGDTGL